MALLLVSCGQTSDSAAPSNSIDVPPAPAPFDAEATAQEMGALLQKGQLSDLAAMTAVVFGTTFDSQHPTARAFVELAQHEGVDIEEMLKTIKAADLVARTAAEPWFTVEQPSTSTGTLLETAAILLEGWEVLAAVAQEEPVNAVPTPHPGWFLISHGSNSNVRIPGTRLDLQAPERALIALSGRANDGSELLLGIEGKFTVPRTILSTTDRLRLSILLEASTELMHQRSLVAFEPSQLRSRYQWALINGSRP